MDSINWDNYNDNSLPPAGKYEVICSNSKKSVSDGGTEYFELQFQITEGAHTGSKFTDKIFLTEKALGRLKLVCSCMGFNTKGITPFPKPEDFLGKFCVVTLEDYKYIRQDGTEANSVKVPFGGYEKTNNITQEKEGEEVPFGL